MTAHHPIVAGVDGSRASLQAVVWAAREAERCRLPLSLVTIVSVRNTFGVPIGMPAGFFEQEGSEGRDMLLDAAEYARRAVPEDELDIETRCAPILRRSNWWTHRSRRRWSWSGPGTTGSAGSDSVRSAERWSRVRWSSASTVRSTVCAVSAAFEEASLRGTDMVAAHAWSDLDVRGPFRFRIEWDSVENKGAGTVVRESRRARRGVPRRAGAPGGGAGPALPLSGIARCRCAVARSRPSWSRRVPEPDAGIHHMGAAAHGDLARDGRPVVRGAPDEGRFPAGHAPARRARSSRMRCSARATVRLVCAAASGATDTEVMPRRTRCSARSVLVDTA